MSMPIVFEIRELEGSMLPFFRNEGISLSGCITLNFGGCSLGKKKKLG